jgi:hypothetical protein
VVYLSLGKTWNAPGYESGAGRFFGAMPRDHRALRASGRWLALFCTFYSCLAGVVPVSAAEAYSADAVKAEFLYRFAGYVEWPTELPADAPFTIAVVGADGVFSELQQLKPGRTIQNRPVEIRRVMVASDLERVQILYVAPRARGGARALLAAAVGRPILIVSDEAGGLAAGSAVNFVLVDRHVRFEISLTAAERSRLKINSGLLSVAAKVEGARPHADASCWQMPAFGLAPACLRRSVLAADPRVLERWSARLARAADPR